MPKKVIELNDYRRFYLMHSDKSDLLFLSGHIIIALMAVLGALFFHKQGQCVLMVLP
jgi:hypothetical protein